MRAGEDVVGKPTVQLGDCNQGLDIITIGGRFDGIAPTICPSCRIKTCMARFVVLGNEIKMYLTKNGIFFPSFSAGEDFSTDTAGSGHSFHLSLLRLQASLQSSMHSVMPRCRFRGTETLTVRS